MARDQRRTAEIKHQNDTNRSKLRMEAAIQDLTVKKAIIGTVIEEDSDMNEADRTFDHSLSETELMLEAVSRNELEAKVKSYNEVRNLHLVQIFCYRRYRLMEKWCNDIATFPDKIPLMKGSNRRPSDIQIHAWMMEGLGTKGVEDHSSFGDMIKEINKKADAPDSQRLPKIRGVLHDHLWEFINEILIWVAIQYHDKGYFTGDEARRWITKQFNRNPHWKEPFLDK